MSGTLNVIRDLASRHRLMYGAAIVAALLSLTLRAAIPISADGYLLHDDALFTRLAQNIASGAWLGPFDNLTLAKGAFYPLFVAAAHLLHLPLPLAEQLAYLGAAALAAFAVARIAGSRAAGVALFVLLALDPTNFHPVLARVIRESLYLSVGLAVAALATLVAFDGAPRRHWRRVASLASLGLAFAAFWLTREESVWLYPALGVVALGALVQNIMAWRESKPAWRPLALAIAAEGAIATAGFALIVGGVLAMNQAHYGVAMTNEFREGAFPSAYGAIQRIEPKQWTSHLIFDDSVAARAYEVSAAMRELKPALDGENGKMWREIGCNAVSLAPCPNVFVRGWFMWALRDAALLAGHYKSAGEAQAFYERLAREINEACDTGRIRCLARRDVMTPPLALNYAGPWAISFGDSLAILAHWRPVAVGAPPSKGRLDQIATFESMVGSVAPFELTGWAASRVCVPKVRVADEPAADIEMRARYEPAKDVEALFAKAGATVPATRFHILTDCRADACRLVFDGCDPIAAQPLTAANAEGFLPGTGEVLVRIERLAQGGEGAPIAPSPFWRAQMMGLAYLYALLAPLLLLAGFAGLGIAAWHWREVATRALPLASLTLAAFAAILARAALIAAFDVTSAYSVNVLYLSPAAPFVLVFGVTGAMLFLRLRQRAGSRTATSVG